MWWPVLKWYGILWLISSFFSLWRLRRIFSTAGCPPLLKVYHGQIFHLLLSKCFKGVCREASWFFSSFPVTYELVVSNSFPFTLVWGYEQDSSWSLLVRPSANSSLTYHFSFTFAVWIDLKLTGMERRKKKSQRLRNVPKLSLEEKDSWWRLVLRPAGKAIAKSK